MRFRMLQDAYSAPVDSDVVIDPNEVRPWSIETRIKDHREMRAEKEKHENQKKSNMDKLMAGVSSSPRTPLESPALLRPLVFRTYLRPIEPRLAHRRNLLSLRQICCR
jgi:hypothetical protein